MTYMICMFLLSTLNKIINDNNLNPCPNTNATFCITYLLLVLTPTVFGALHGNFHTENIVAATLRVVFFSYSKWSAGPTQYNQFSISLKVTHPACLAD